jgi:uncharacterized protein YjbJ (UPF0337 family)
VVANITGGGQWADATGKAREMVGKMTLEEKVSKLVKRIQAMVGLTADR